MGNNFGLEEYQRLWDSYFYPETDVFINKLNIRDNNELEKVEREITNNKLKELHDNPIDGSFDIKHLCDIHKYLFEDLYPWAGQFRDVYMKKVDGSYFAPVDKIELYLKKDLDLLNHNLRETYNLDTLANFITEFYVAILTTHPFREGNGRATREFLREFTLYKTNLLWGIGYDIDWSRVNHELVDSLMPFGRAYYGSIRMEVLKAIIPYERNDYKKK